MTDSDTRAEVWKPIPGARYYEASDRGGRIRSVPRTINGRFYEGKVLTAKRSGTSPYPEVKITFDDKKQRTVPVHVLVLRAHRGMPEPGQEACHLHDDPDINDLSELRWDRPEANDADRARNHPPKPRPVKECVRCGAAFEGNGRRCHPCVVWIGVMAAKLLRSGVTLAEAAERLGYPSLDGLHTLARRYGGYGQSSLRSVRIRLASWFAGGDAP